MHKYFFPTSCRCAHEHHLPSFMLSRCAVPKSLVHLFWSGYAVVIWQRGSVAYLDLVVMLGAVNSYVSGRYNVDMIMT